MPRSGSGKLKGQCGLGVSNRVNCRGVSSPFYLTSRNAQCQKEEWKQSWELIARLILGQYCLRIYNHFSRRLFQL